MPRHSGQHLHLPGSKSGTEAAVRAQAPCSFARLGCKGRTSQRAFVGKGDLEVEDAYTYKGLRWDLLPLPLLNMFSVKFNNFKKNPRASLETSILPLGTFTLIRDTDLKRMFYLLLQGLGGTMLLVDDKYFE